MRAVASDDPDGHICGLQMGMQNLPEYGVGRGGTLSLGEAFHSWCHLLRLADAAIHRHI